MGIIKDKLTAWVKKATETATETVKEITKEDASRKLDILGDIAKVGILTLLTVATFKSASHGGIIKEAVASEPVAQAVTPVVQIFLGEGKGVHIQ